MSGVQSFFGYVELIRRALRDRSGDSSARHWCDSETHPVTVLVDTLSYARPRRLCGDREGCRILP